MNEQIKVIREALEQMLICMRLNKIEKEAGNQYNENIEWLEYRALHKEDFDNLEEKSADAYKKGQEALIALASLEQPTEPTQEQIDYKTKYEKLKEFVRGKWKGDCSECAAIANEIFNKENAMNNKSEV